MARKVDPTLTRQAINWLKRARARAEGSGEGVTEWEDEFLASVEERLERFGSAFTDPDKGQLSAPLSLRQGLKVRQIGKRGAKPRARPGAKPGAEPAAGHASTETVEGDGTAPPSGSRSALRSSKGGFGRSGGFKGGKDGGLTRKSGLTRKAPLRARKPGPDRG